MTQTPSIQPIIIHGHEYITVADRIKLCNADEGYTMLSQERYSLAGRYFFSVTIECKNKRYIGDAEIKFDARANTPDGTNPVECAQTSALGRALGMAGYGVLESIASADEVYQATMRQNAKSGTQMSGTSNQSSPAYKNGVRPSQIQIAAPQPPIDEARRAKLNELLELGQQLGQFEKRSGLANYASRVLVREITAEQLTQLSEGDIAEIEAMLHTEEPVQLPVAEDATA